MSDVKNAPNAPRVDPVWDQNRPVWDELRPAGTNGGRGGTGGANWPFYAAVAGISLTIGVVNALSAAQDAAWHGGGYHLGTPLFWEMTSIVTILALAPLLLAAIRRMRQTSRWPLRAGVAIAAMTVFSALHILGMVGLRKLAMWLAGGTYDFHWSVAVLVYEFRKDVVTCLLIGSSFWLIESRREAQRSAADTTAAQAATPGQHLVWLRDGSTRIRIDPRDVLWISSAGNYVEYRLVDGANHLIRGTLAAAEAELRRFNLTRIHRTRLANLDRVTHVEMKPSGDFELTFETGATVQGSRRYKTPLEKLDRGIAPSATPATER
jgi:LytTr DNA-binding domain-containing protein